MRSVASPGSMAVVREACRVRGTWDPVLESSGCHEQYLGQAAPPRLAVLTSWGLRVRDPGVGRVVSLRGLCRGLPVFSRPSLFRHLSRLSSSKDICQGPGPPTTLALISSHNVTWVGAVMWIWGPRSAPHGQSPLSLSAPSATPGLARTQTRDHRGCERRVPTLRPCLGAFPSLVSAARPACFRGALPTLPARCAAPPSCGPTSLLLCVKPRPLFPLWPPPSLVPPHPWDAAQMPWPPALPFIRPQPALCSPRSAGRWGSGTASLAPIW